MPMNDFAQLGADQEPPVSYRQNPAASAVPNPVQLFAAGLLAVWFGTVLGGISMFFIAKAWVRYEIGNAIVEANDRQKAAAKHP